MDWPRDSLESARWLGEPGTNEVDGERTIAFLLQPGHRPCLPLPVADSERACIEWYSAPLPSQCNNQLRPHLGVTHPPASRAVQGSGYAARSKCSSPSDFSIQRQSHFSIVMGCHRKRIGLPIDLLLHRGPAHKGQDLEWNCGS